jgi:hypothetical protein
MAAMTVMIFLLGLLIGILGGGALCVRYLRKEIAADIGPSLGRVQMQLENLDAEVDLVLATRLAELSRADQPPVTCETRDRATRHGRSLSSAYRATVHR